VFLSDEEKRVVWARIRAEGTAVYFTRQPQGQVNT